MEKRVEGEGQEKRVQREGTKDEGQKCKVESTRAPWHPPLDKA